MVQGRGTLSGRSTAAGGGVIRLAPLAPGRVTRVTPCSRGGVARPRGLAALLVLGLVALGASRPAAAAECPAPADFSIAAGGLPAAAAAVRSGQLTILAVGGVATSGTPARGADYTYPARLAVHLADALPGVRIAMSIHAIPREPSTAMRMKLQAVLAEGKPALVVWGPGGSSAGRGDDLDTFSTYVDEIVGGIRTSGADLILMTLQYAPSVARVVNLYPYRMAVLRAGEAAGVPVLDRYDLMRYWSETGFFDLDVTDPEDRVWLARGVYDCMARILAKGIAKGIADAVR